VLERLSSPARGSAAVRRVAPTALALAVLVATTIAFAVAERMKLEPSPILRPRVAEELSPVCRCSRRVAHIAFTLRKGGHVSVAVVDADGDIVRRLGSARYRRREGVNVVWDGRDGRGRVLPDGDYRPRIELGRRTIVMPNTIRIDTHAPRLTIDSVSRRLISPDGDGRFDGVTIDYTTDELAHAILVVDGTRYEEKKRLETAGSFRWYGKLDGRDLGPGVHRLTVAVRDRAGNVSARSRPIGVRIRFLTIAPHIVRARAGSRFRVRVDTDAPTVTWLLDGRRGRAPANRVVLRAPRRGGRYIVTVEASGHRASAIVRVPRSVHSARPARRQDGA